MGSRLDVRHDRQTGSTRLVARLPESKEQELSRGTHLRSKWSRASQRRKVFNEEHAWSRSTHRGLIRNTSQVRP